MWPKLSTSICLLLTLLIKITSAIQINLRKGETRCVYLTGFAKNMLFTGKFQINWRKPGQKDFEIAPENFGLYIEITEAASKNIVVAKSFANDPGKFSFICDTPKLVHEYEICISVDSPTYNMFLKNYRDVLRIDYVQYRKYEDIISSMSGFLNDQKEKFANHIKQKEIEKQNSATKSKMTIVQFLMENVQNRVNIIAEEQTRWYDFESVFREKSQDLSDFIFYWSLVNLSAVICIGMYQVYHLQNFFVKKKIV